ncbi:MAG: DUF2330 domain-containing protein [Methanomassiliicoccales archaeon]|nr:MAG: DUF2330 domain-containing protein [Methanomassiliicoccales archaeon]
MIGRKSVKFPKITLIFLFFITICILLTTQLVSADGGLIPYHEFSVYEPGQKAIIAWDGQIEVMILSVDVFSVEDTKALHMVPFPSLPTIELGDADSFQEIQKIINSKSRNAGSLFGDKLYEGSGNDYSGTVEIIFHESVGPHDITVVKVNSSHEFSDWVNDFLSGQGIEDKTMPTNLDEVVEHYIQENISYFAFDVIDIARDEMSVDPIIYTFETDYIYFPLKISSIIDGDTEVTLAIITPKDMAINTRMMDGYGFYNSVEVMVSYNELARVDQNIADQFKDEARLTFFREEFYLQDLNEDVVLDKTEGIRYVDYGNDNIPAILMGLLIIALIRVILFIGIFIWYL